MGKIFDMGRKNYTNPVSINYLSHKEIAVMTTRGIFDASMRIEIFRNEILKVVYIEKGMFISGYEISVPPFWISRFYTDDEIRKYGILMCIYMAKMRQTSIKGDWMFKGTVPFQ